MILVNFKGLIQTNIINNVASHFSCDEVAEWLRRWTANPLCSARVGSNPILVDKFFSFLHSFFFFYLFLLFIFLLSLTTTYWAFCRRIGRTIPLGEIWSRETQRAVVRARIRNFTKSSKKNLPRNRENIHFFYIIPRSIPFAKRKDCFGSSSVQVDCREERLAENASCPTLLNKHNIQDMFVFVMIAKKL